MDRKVSFQGSSKFNVVFRQALRRNEALVANFWELRRRADIYYAWSPSKNGRDHLSWITVFQPEAYSYIHSYIQEPFTTLLPEHVFNCALWNVLASSGFSAQPVANLLAQVQGGPEAEAAYLEKSESWGDGSRAESSAQAKGHLLKEVPLGISRVYILYALAKQSQSLGAFKLARMAYDKLQVLRVPPTWQHQIDLACLSIRSKAYSDQDDLLPVCNWCMTTNPLLRSNLDSCINCGHPFLRTFLGFDILPLVEFQPESDISLEEAQKLIAQEPNRTQSSGWGAQQRTAADEHMWAMPNAHVILGDGWHETTRAGAEVMSLNEALVASAGEGPSGDNGGTDLFVQKMLDAASYFVPGEPYQPVKIDRETLADLRPQEVYTADFRRFSPLLPVRFFRSMIPEVAIAVCGACGNFFHQETWELEFLQNRCCPYCGSKDPAESAVSAVSKTKTPIIVGFLETAEIEGGKKRRNLITCTKARISRGPFAREM
ncbi:unnamed protein product [Cladocopium goreaui]|uniref:Intraflagellar transport protein 122 homolog n=1 Tax=Cladocopium goreaui TaxID=2562237 RepID=A0A9P1CPX2_9DINO|nr:unnamed protein product [Cladocopium goreaui]